MDDPLLWQLLLQLVLIMVNAVFACAEIAVLSINENRVEKLAAQGDRRAARLKKMTAQPAGFLATIQVGITLAGFLGSAFAADNFAQRLTAWAVSLGAKASASVINTVSVVLITLVLSYFTLVLGELVPKRIAMRKAEQLALLMSGFLWFMSKVFAPIVGLLTASTNGLLRLLGIDPNAKDEEVTEEGIRLMVDAGGEQGAIDPEEQEMIQNVFEFDDITVDEIATHRTEVVKLWLDETADEWLDTINESRHSIYPVCRENVDDVAGVLYAKDFFLLTDKSPESLLANAVRPAQFVPETVKADALFRQMKKTRNHFAVTVDEYGGMSGIVTMNDLLEQLVGELPEDDEAPTSAPVKTKPAR